MKKILLFFLLIFSFSVLAQEENIIRGVQSPTNPNIAKGQTWAIVIGISDYQNIQDLRFADNDALLVSKYLIETRKINPNQIKVFLNKNASRVNITSELYQLSTKLVKGDKLIFYFAGHGDLESQIDPEQPDQNVLLLLNKAPDKNYLEGFDFLDLSQLRKELNQFVIKGVQVVFISDACHAGAGSLSGGKTGQNITGAALQLESKGQTKILSCQANELSEESGDIQHGIFTYFFIKGLEGEADFNKDSNIQNRELENFLDDNVSKRTRNAQNPLILGDKTLVMASLSDTITTKWSIPEKPLEKTEEKKFKLALQKSNFLRPLNNSAIYWLNQLIIKKTADEKITIYKTLLIDSVFQQVSAKLQPLFAGEISGYLIKDYVEMQQNLESILTLINENHWLYNTIKSRSLFLEGYIIYLNSFNAKGSALTKKLEVQKKLEQSLKLEEIPFAHLILANSFNSSEDWERGLEHLSKAKRMLPKSSKVHEVFAAMYFLQDKDSHLSLSHLDTALVLGARPAQINAKRALYYAYKFQYDSTAKYAKRSIKFDSTYYMPYYTLGIVELLGNKDTTQSFLLLKKSLNSIRKHPETILNDGVGLADIYNYFANGFEAISNYSKSIEYSKLALKDDSTDFKNYIKLSRYLILNSQLEDVPKYLTIAQKFAPRDKDVYLNWADYYKAKRDGINEERNLLRAIDIDTIHYECLTQLGRFYIRQKNDSLAKFYLNWAEKKDTSNYIAQNQIGSAYLDFYTNYGFERAIVAFKRSIKLNPTNFMTYGTLSFVYVNQKKYDKAKDVLKKALGIDSTKIEIYQGFGAIYNAIDSTEMAKKYLKKALTLKGLPVEYQALFRMLAEIYKSQDSIQTAIIFYKKAIQSISSISSKGLSSIDKLTLLSVYENLAGCYFKLKDTLEVKNILYKHLASMELNFYGLMNVANLYSKLNDTTNAMIFYEKAIKYDSNHLQTYYAYFNIGIIKFSNKSYSVAIDYFKKAYNATPEFQPKQKFVAIVFYTAYSYMALKQNDEAIKYAKQAIELSPTDKSGYEILGDLYNKQGKYSEASEAFHKVMELNPKGWSAYYNLSCLYSLQKKTNESLDFLEKSLKNGYKDLKHINNDSDLDNIRQSTQFQALIKMYFPDKK